MRRLLAVLWLAVVVAACGHVGLRMARGLSFQTDLMALLPQEERDPTVQRAKEAVARAVAQRVVVLVGHRDRGAARAAAASLQADLIAAGVLEPAGDVPAKDALERLGRTYFPHRAGLLAEPDRRRLAEGRGAELVTRALSQVFGFAGIADARLLAADPFLLLPAFLSDLPVPASRVAMDEGMPTVTDAGTTWVLVTGRVTGEPFALEFQDRFVAAWDAALAKADAQAPGLAVRRLGALFYAHAGAAEAMAESSFIGLGSTAGSAALILLAFRAATPLLLSFAALGAGIVAALSACLLLFGELHVAALMFGAGLIGVAVDYSLHYFAQIFTARKSAAERLAHVMPGIVLGLLTTLVGYATLALSPFPGLRQVAVFSAVGLIGSFLSVVLWCPLLDRAGPARLGAPVARLAARVWTLWEGRRRRLALVAVGAAVAAAGLTALRTDDDVRRQQGLSPVLVAEQAEVQRLTGFGQTTQFFLVQAPSTEQALAREEALGERLAAVVAKGALAGWQSPARFAPSAERQRDSRALVAERLERPHLAALRARLGMPGAPVADPPAAPLGLAEVAATGALPLLSALVLDEGVHLVTLDGLKDPALVKSAAEGLEGVRFIDPTGDLTELLGAYRRRAVALLGLSALLMAPLLAWRYGARGGLWVMAPPVAAVALTPAVLALFGLPFTFFGAMALVLVLSIGVDYAVFCAEEAGRRDPVTMLAVWLATLTTALSFGLLAFSRVAGVQSFGATMLAGIALAFVLSPLAARAHPMRSVLRSGPR